MPFFFFFFADAVRWASSISANKRRQTLPHRPPAPLDGRDRTLQSFCGFVVIHFVIPQKIDNASLSDRQGLEDIVQLGPRAEVKRIVAAVHSLFVSLPPPANCLAVAHCGPK